MYGIQQQFDRMFRRERYWIPSQQRSSIGKSHSQQMSGKRAATAAFGLHDKCPLWAEWFDYNRRRSSVERFGRWAYPVAYRLACPEVARARCRAAPEYFMTIARLLWPVIACTSSSEAPAAVSCAAAV
jgi:hypothetical protein